MANNYAITETEATAAEVAHIMDAIESVIGDVKPAHAVIALLMLSVLIQHPEISEAHLQNVVLETSKYICLLLTGTDEISIPPRMMN